jgi:hypothetical protein
MNNQIFQTDQTELEEISWSLMLRKKTELQLYKERQDKLLQEVFEE